MRNLLYEWKLCEWAGNFYRVWCNKYVGVLKGDMRDGQGTLTYPDGSKYAGEWNADKMNGQGTLTSPDGTVKSGTWKDSKLDN